MDSKLWSVFPFNIAEKENDVYKIVQTIKEYLSENNISINKKTWYYGYTLLHLACSTNIDSLVATLLRNFADEINIHVTNSLNETALNFAVLGGDKEVVDQLLRLGAKTNVHRKGDGKTALHLACRKELIHMLEFLLNESTIEINAQDDQKWTPLHYAVMENDFRMVKILLEHGADPNAKGRYDETPLHLASKKGSNRILVELLENGALVNVASTFGSTPLHLVVLDSNEYAVRKFLEYGADPNISPSVKRKHIIHSALLLKNIHILSLILHFSRNLEVKDEYSFTPLQRAVQMGNEEKVKILLKYKANVNVVSRKDNKSLILYSVELGRFNITKLILQSGAVSNINLASNTGNLPLLEAIRSYKLDFVQLLRDYGGATVGK